MRHDVHAAALRAAAKVAFSTLIIGGCSSPNASIGASEGELLSGETAPTTAEPPNSESADAATASDHDAAPKQDCRAVLDVAFGDAGGEWGPNTDLRKDVKACCIEELETGTFHAPHRAPCCSSLDWGMQDGLSHAVMVACTPWGPPVPPPMRRRAGPIEGAGAGVA